MKVVYIAGKFRGKDHYEIHQNIIEAERIAFYVWQAGFVALCPHLNTRNFQGSLPDDVWLKGDLELLKRCDALVTVWNWRASMGAIEEVTFARNNKIPVYEDVELLKFAMKEEK